MHNDNHDNQINRRQMLSRSGLALAGLPLMNSLSTPWFSSAQAQETEGFHNRFPRMVQEYYVDRLERFKMRNDKAWNQVTSPTHARAFIQDRKANIQKAFGPFPEKTDLNTRITGVLLRPDYKVEKIIFESRPGFKVTANLWIPTGIQEPMPGVIGVCGHSTTGKAAEPYQAFAQGLCRLGFVVFMIDPLGQGERLQSPRPDGQSRFGVGVREHLKAGNQQFLVGEFIGMWRAWDGIRALDYLLTRPEIDPNRVGITGNSGGGTMTTWLCGLEDRWTMAAPSCFVTSFCRNLENELPADTEQCPPNTLALGLDHVDYLAAMAPKPLILLAKEKDYFDVRGTEEAYARLKKLYTLLGAADQVALFAGPTGHGYSIENREAMYGWFTQWSHMEKSVHEPELTYENPEDLQCTRDGQVDSWGSRSIFDFTRNTAIRMAAERPAPDPTTIQTWLSKKLNLTVPEIPPTYRILRVVSERDYPLSRVLTYLVHSDPGIDIPVYYLTKETHLSRPQPESKNAVLYVSHLSSDQELRKETWLKNLIQKQEDHALFAMDVRGIGESQPNTCGGSHTFHTPYGNDYFYAIHGIMLGDPYPGQKARDILSTLAFLRNAGFQNIQIIAHKWGTLPAALAALVDARLQGLHLHDALASYQDVAMREDYDWPLSSFVPGVLAHFDLPDVYASIRQFMPLEMT